MKLRVSFGQVGGATAPLDPLAPPSIIYYQYNELTFKPELELINKIWVDNFKYYKQIIWALTNRYTTNIYIYIY